MATILNADNGVVSGISGLTTSADNSGVLQFQTSGTNTLTITTAGNVGIGTTSPTSISGYTVLEVNGNTSGAILDLAQGDVMRGRFVGAASSFAVETSGSIPIVFVPGGSERMRIDSSGNVGIGTSSPSTYGKLAVNGSTYIAGSYCLQVTRAIGSQGAIIDSPADSTLAFYNWAGTERMRIDSAGNVGIGVTPSAWNSLYRAIQLPFGASLTGRTDTAETLLASNTYRDSVGFKYFGTGNATSYFQTSGQHIWQVAPSGTAGNAITFTQAMTLDSSGRLLVGKTSPTANGGDIQVSTGITFPATQSAASDANTLDDYEQGTFTPALSREGTAPTISYSLQSGQYTKIGNVVTVYISIVATSVSSAGSGNTTITGLPFANGGTTYTGSGAITYNDAGVATLSGSWISSTTVLFRSGTKSSGNDNSGWQAGYMYMTITYLTS